MDHAVMTGQRATFDSPIGEMAVEVTARGLRRVFLPRAGRRGREPPARLPSGAGLASGPEPPGTARADAGPPGAGPSGAPTGDAASTAAAAAGQIMEYLRGERRQFDLPLDLTGVSTESRAVLDELCVSAAYGKVITYGELARLTGCPGGARAVGQIMARNPLPLVVPCHRVVAAGDLGGYGGGIGLKRWLLRLEGALTEQLSLLGDG